MLQQFVKLVELQRAVLQRAIKPCIKMFLTRFVEYHASPSSFRSRCLRDGIVTEKYYIDHRDQQQTIIVDGRILS